MLPLIRERDLERFLLFSFLHQAGSRAAILDSVNSFHPKTWTGVRGCVRAVLWVGVRDYVDENEELIRDAFERCNEGWWFMLNSDVAGISDFESPAMLSGLGETGQRAAEAAHGFAARQADPRGIFTHYENFMRFRSESVPPPATDRDWRSLGEVCFWLGHLRTESPACDWLSEDVLTAVLQCDDIQSMCETCVGVFELWGERYSEWYERNRERILEKLRSALGAISLVEENDLVTAVFLLTGEEIGLSSQDPSTTQTAKPSLNDLVVSKLRVIRCVLPFKERYGCKGIGHLTSLVDPPHDESVKTGILKKYLLPRWGPELNHLFSQLADFQFRLPTWADLSNEVLRIRQSVLDSCAELRAGILGHYESKRPVNIIEEHLSLDRWERLKTDCFRVAFLPQCAVDEWGLDSAGDDELPAQRAGKTLGQHKEAASRYSKVAREYARALDNFLTQAPPVLVWNGTMGKIKGKQERKQTAIRLKKAGINAKNRRLTKVNLADLCKGIDGFQLELGGVFAERVEIEEHVRLSPREMRELSGLYLLWHEFVEHPGSTRDAADRRTRLQVLRNLDTERILADLRTKLDRALTRISGDGIDFRVLHTHARWESKPTMWIACDASDPSCLLDASRVVEGCLRSALAACRDDDTQGFVAQLYWQHIVAVPLVAGESLRKTAYPHLWGAVHMQTAGESKEWRHIALPVPDVTWQRTGLEHWQLPRLREFQEFVDTVARLWEMCGHFANLGRDREELDDLGAGIAQRYIRENQDAFSTLAQDVIDQREALWGRFETLSEAELSERPMLEECFSLVMTLTDKLVPREEWSGDEKVTMSELAEWHDRLTEAVGVVGLAELFWSADALGLTCDLERLEKKLGEAEAGTPVNSHLARRKKKR